jgi:hypothetical protein
LEVVRKARINKEVEVEVSEGSPVELLEGSFPA